VSHLIKGQSITFRYGLTESDENDSVSVLGNSKLYCVDESVGSPVASISEAKFQFFVKSSMTLRHPQPFDILEQEEVWSLIADQMGICLRQFAVFAMPATVLAANGEVWAGRPANEPYQGTVTPAVFYQFFQFPGECGVLRKICDGAAVVLVFWL